MTTRMMPIVLAMSAVADRSMVTSAASGLLAPDPGRRRTIFIQTGRFAPHAAELVPERPFQRVLYIFMHDRTGCAHHPAVLRTFAHHGTHLLRPGALPYLHEIGRLVDVAHRFLPVFLFQSIAGIDVAEGVDEEIGGSGLARQHTPAAFDVVDQPHVEPSPEPALGVVLLQLHAINCSKFLHTSSLLVMTLSSLWK